jgi:hypothetical protein
MTLPLFERHGESAVPLRDPRLDEDLQQAIGLMIGFAQPFDVRQSCSRQHAERALIDDLISRIQFRHDEVHRGTEAQHVMLIGVFVRTEARE